MIDRILLRVHALGERRVLGAVGLLGLIALVVWTTSAGNYESFQLARFCIFTLLFAVGRGDHR